MNMMRFLRVLRVQPLWACAVWAMQDDKLDEAETLIRKIAAAVSAEAILPLGPQHFALLGTIAIRPEGSGDARRHFQAAIDTSSRFRVPKPNISFGMLVCTWPRWTAPNACNRW